MTFAASAHSPSGDIASLMADASIAQVHMSGAPLIVAGGMPLQVLYASASAASLFGTRDHGVLTRRLFDGSELGSQRLKYLAAQPAPLAPRLERLRFFVGGGSETLTVLCRGVTAASGASLLVLAAMGVRAALLRASVPDVAEDLLLATKNIDADAEVTALLQPTPAASAVVSDVSLPAVVDEIALPEITLPQVTQSPSPVIENLAPVATAALDAAGRKAETVRFAWRSDAHGKLSGMPEVMQQALGLPGAGGDWQSVLANRQPQGHEALTQALAAQATFAAVATRWPVANGLLPVTFGASPLHDSQGHFMGHRGYGLALFNQMEVWASDAAHLASPEAATPDSNAELVEHDAIVVAQAHLDEPDSGVEAHDAPPALRSSTPVTVDESASVPPQTIPLESPTPSKAEQDNIVRLRPLQGHLKLASKMETGNAPVHAVFLPEARANAEAAPVASSLSNSERAAFSEIARSLTAKIKDTAPEILIAAPRLACAEPKASAVVAAETQTVAQMALPDAPLPCLAMTEPTGASAALDHLPLGVLVCRDGAPLFINRYLLDMLGYADAAAFVAANGFVKMFRGRQPEALHPSPEGGALPLVDLAGEVVMAETRLQALEWQGAPASFLTFRRASENEGHARLQTLEMELRQHETQIRELHSILDTATDGVVILDETGCILSLNRSAEALFGLDQNEVAGAPFTVLVANDQEHLANDYFKGIKTSGVASVLNDGREILGRARQGGAIPLFMTLGRVGPGNNPKFCAIMRDLTQWKKVEGELGDARREAERASQLKSDFLAKISHEIRTPLNAILGFTEVMAEERFGPIGNERYKDYLKDIHTSGAHVMSLVNDLLDLSKIEAGKMEMEFASVDANKVVGEAVSLMQLQAASARIVIRLSLAPRLPNIVVDERALRQIVLNLLSNAVKYNEVGGQVIVSTALTDAGHAVIRIRDTGIGMSETDMISALEPFKQLQTSRKQSGTGLGLPLTKALVEANRASLTIKSKKAEGTMVEVAFPPTRVLAE